MSILPYNEARLARIKKLKEKLSKILNIQKQKEVQQIEKIKQARTGQPIELIGYAVYDKEGNDTGKRFANKEDAEEYQKALWGIDKN